MLKGKNHFSFLDIQPTKSLLENPLEGLTKIDRTFWVSDANNYNPINAKKDEGPPHLILDNLTNTIWHSKHSNTNDGKGQQNSGGPFWFIIDLKMATKIRGFEYVPRGEGANGLFKDFKFYIGNSISEIEEKVGTERFLTSGQWNYNSDTGVHSEIHRVRLDQEVECSCIALWSTGFCDS
ncbi:hypothetical protein TRFO_24427 [Tritrichomonas foetus]|uniref:F5/8 type C domain-containing protein n=1 Tax=Tritrichomonas foetus TaxID=1144522 RepID=A0A1J4K7Q2_9EUKA|nr:hypothetical protein TRFO_24427 [Tritrichomonas foetus]|eukprot:OHT07407.1 hypothetical protein TRFO_24427 [Tritrichomonas foetus]